MLSKPMSLTRTISSYFWVKVLRSGSRGSFFKPENNSAYMRYTRSLMETLAAPLRLPGHCFATQHDALYRAGGRVSKQPLKSMDMKVLVVVAGGLHLGYLGCYGNLWIETPCLDRLAAEGIVFDQHYADCPASNFRTSWTGRYCFPGLDGGDD